jgi:glycosidase
MAKNTPKTYRNLVIYQVYVRNHGPNGTFAEVEADLPRIRSMGVDVVYFIPIHPIGKLNKKGGLGCPFSITDYRKVNPEYGTLVDFKRLIERAHALGLKVMIDVVFNHTAHDSHLAREHPDWFHQDEGGNLVTTEPDWSDVVDLKHPNPGLTDYLIDILKYWVELGVDGFRCDVASLIPVEFWLEAREAVAEVNPDVIWLAESVHAAYVEIRRVRGLFAISDSELYAAFDITYDYDIWPVWQGAVRGSLPLSRYIEMLRFQDAIYPANYVKMRCVENHDQPRIMRFASGRAQALAWTALIAFNKGPFFIYAGQEAAATHTPSLFDIDKVEWRDYALQDFITRLARLKKDPAQVDGQLIFTVSEPAVQAIWFSPEASLFGLFNTSGSRGEVSVPLPDADYKDLLGDKNLRVEGGKMELPESAVFLRCFVAERPESLPSDLLW